jgi:Domain of unknown function (DUF4234)
MAETVTIEGQPFLKRQPLGVLGLSFITLGIYFFYWYYKVNEEIQRFEHDDSISPVRSLMAILFGWIIIVPPFIAMYNTAKHVRTIEERLSIPSQLEPALVIIIMLLFSIANGLYIQEHLNRIWDRSAGAAAPPQPLPGDPGTTPMPGPPSS